MKYSNLPDNVTQKEIDSKFAVEVPDYEISIVAIYRDGIEAEIHIKFHFDRRISKYMYDNDISGEEMAYKPDIITVDESEIKGMDYEQIITYIRNQYNY